MTSSPNTRQRESVELSKAELDALKRLARLHDCRSERGIDAGQPSWRVLIQKIGRGEMGVYRIS